MQVDACAIFRIIAVCQVVFKFSCIRISGSLTDSTEFATSEDLENIAFLDIDGCAAPDFRILTITATEKTECGSENVHAVLIEDYTTVSSDNLIILLIII